MNSNVAAYDVIERSQLTDLVEAVNARIEEGWQPTGELATGDFQGHAYYAQVIVKHYPHVEKGAPIPR